MRVFVRPCGVPACDFYRLTAPARALAGELNIIVAEQRLVSDGRESVVIGKSVNSIANVDADVVYVQRPTEPRLVEAIPRLQARGIAVVVDMDDDLSNVHQKNGAFLDAERYRHNVDRACAEATLVTVTTPALAERYGSHGRVRVIPNFVPESYLRIPHKDSATIGWGGYVGTNPDGLQTLGPAIRNLVDHGLKFITAGEPGGVARALGLKYEPRGLGHQELAQWPYALSKFGIGIAPLARSIFNESKSRLRPLQFAAVGVPWVGSPAPDYVAFHELGTGLIADTPDEWESHLRNLVIDAGLRHEMADRGREVAKANTIEANAYLWAEAWAEAVEIEKATSRRRRRHANR